MAAAAAAAAAMAVVAVAGSSSGKQGTSPAPVLFTRRDGAAVVARDPDDVGATPSLPTIQHFIMGRARDGELAMLVTAICTACKGITRAVRKAGIAGLYGLAGSANTSGDAVKKLDILSNDIMVTALLNSHTCAVLVSEENEAPIIVDAARQGRYCVAFDPLDGSSNIDCNVSTGTIFAVWEKTTPGPGTLADILRPGDEIVCAGYCMYGSATEMVITGASDEVFGRGAQRFTLDPSLGEFMYTGPLTLPADGGKRIYSCNEGNYVYWDTALQRSVRSLKGELLHEDGKVQTKPYALRYVGSMVSDIHRTLLYGGVFLYPADKKSKDGKLRVLYEGFPMALITEAAFGVASTGLYQGKIQRILSLQPQSIHERCPIIMGCARDVHFVLQGYTDMEQAGSDQEAIAATQRPRDVHTLPISLAKL